MHDKSIACNRAYVSQKSILSGSARVEDDAYVRGAILTDQARVSGFSQVLCSGDTLYSPMLSGRCAVYGDVYGNTQLTGSALVIRGEEVRNDTPDTLVIDGERRYVCRDPSRDELTPKETPRQQEKKKERGISR